MLLIPKAFPAAKQEKIRKLIDSEGFPILIELFSTLAFKHEVEAANAAVGDTEGYEAKAKLEAKKAVTIHSAVHILEQLREGKVELVDFTATPSKKPITKT